MLHNPATSELNTFHRCATTCANCTRSSLLCLRVGTSRMVSTWLVSIASSLVNLQLFGSRRGENQDSPLAKISTRIGWMVRAAYAAVAHRTSSTIQLLNVNFAQDLT